MCGDYHSYGKSILNGSLMGRSSVNGQFSIAMLNNKRVYNGLYIYIVAAVGDICLTIWDYRNGMLF